MDNKGTEASKYVWKGAIPLQIHLHDSEVTTLPPPPPLLILAPRIGYLPLLAPQIKPLFSITLPPGDDTVWFEYNGLPLKWYIPTGVLFDLLCAEPERPWNLTVHFRGYPSNALVPCDGEEAVKWSFINSLKEAAYIISGNCKNVMNMSQSDQLELWSSVLNGSLPQEQRIHLYPLFPEVYKRIKSRGNLESFLKVTSKLKLGAIEDEYTVKLYPSPKPLTDAGITDNSGFARTGRIPVRLYARILTGVFNDLEDVPEVESWEKISYINRPIGFDKDEGKCFTLNDAMKTLLPEYFEEGTQKSEKTAEEEVKEERSEDSGDTKVTEAETTSDTKQPSESAEIKLIRIQGIEPKPEIPFSWVVNNLMNPDHYLHICVYLTHPQSASFL